MADAGGPEVDGGAATTAPRPRWRRGPFVALVVVLVVAVVGAGTIWWTHRSDDLPIGSVHRVSVMVREVHQGDCLNNISDITVEGHHYSTDWIAPGFWGSGEVVGHLEITAPPGPGDTAMFTADAGDDQIPFTGGFKGQQFDDLTCVVH